MLSALRAYSVTRTPPKAPLRFALTGPLDPDENARGVAPLGAHPWTREPGCCRANLAKVTITPARDSID